MSNQFNTPTLQGFATLGLGAEKANIETARKSVQAAIEPKSTEFEVISNLGRMPRPWILWELIRAKREM
jgi:hypothetical protein